MTDRSQDKRLAENIQHMTDAASGKGKYFIQPETAREIRDDLKSYRARLDADRQAEEEKKAQASYLRRAGYAVYVAASSGKPWKSPEIRKVTVELTEGQDPYDAGALDTRDLISRAEVGQWEGMKFTEQKEAPQPVTMQTMRDLIAHLKANDVRRHDGMVHIPAHPNSNAAYLATAIACGHVGDRVLSIRDDGRCQHILCRDHRMPDGKIELTVHSGGWEYEAIQRRYADLIVTTGVLEDDLRRRQTISD
jgi:hypothetical protein